ncbi:MAG: hypothetical protein HRT92_09325 [Piscirickettsiaceae bacterium]|nr:hypothetical protein [Piscirickettsiaceae bacterium]
MMKFKIMMILWLSCILSVQANESITLSSETGDTLMIHRLKNGEIWGSFLITDQVADSFAENELIVMQVDQHQPIKLDHQKLCGSPAREAQKVSYSFQSEPEQAQWQFSRVAESQPNILKLTGWDKETYQHMKSDRRPELVDFPIQANLALVDLWQQFQQGKSLVFRYVTDAGESRQAVFELPPEKIHQLIEK